MIIGITFVGLVAHLSTGFQIILLIIVEFLYLIIPEYFRGSMYKILRSLIACTNGMTIEKIYGIHHCFFSLLSFCQTNGCKFEVTIKK